MCDARIFSRSCWRYIAQAIAAVIFLTCASTGYALSFPDEPIAYIGHGVFFDKTGKPIAVTPEFVEQAQAFYLSRLYERANDEQKKRLDEVKKRYVSDKKWDRQNQMLAQTMLLDVYLDEINPDQAHWLRGKNNLLKTHLRKSLEGTERGKAFKPNAEVSELLKNYQKKPDSTARGFSTMLSGQAYIDECAANGVPIPPDWGSSQWVHTGNLTDAQNFLFDPFNPSEARVHKYTPTNTEGSCIALPRVSGSTIGLLGIICLSKQTGKACFWDNQDNDSGFPITWGDSVPLADFAGGAELLGGSGGACTTCHSGENPYVLHPGTALGEPALGGLQTMADVWYDPLVHPNWPQNAGPTNILATVASPGNCTSCHVQGAAGRFPKISSAINTVDGSYCNAVLNNAVTRTMPPGNPGDPAYAAHVTALQNQCGASANPQMRVESVLNFGEVELGFAFKKALVIHNDGDAALTVSVTRTTPNGDPNVTQWSELNEITPIIIQPGDDPLVLPQVYEPQALGTHTIQFQVAGNDPSTPTQNVVFSGKGIAPIPVDSLLVLDRSGSMNDLAGDRKKIEAMRDAAQLYTDLLRDNIGSTGTGDKLGFVKYNQSNSVYLPLDFITSARKNAIGFNELSDAALTDAGRIKPDGTTGIGGGMEEAAGVLGGPLVDRKQVMIVLTDGKENETPYISAVLGGIEAGNNKLQLYALGLGFDIEPTKLQSITNMGTGGYHQVSGSLTGESLFDLETFYFKIFSNATGMELVVDPTHAINLTSSTAITVDKATIISSDHSANFLVLDDPALRQFYDLEFVSPKGTVMTAGASVGGIPIQEMSRHTYRIFRIVFPDLAQQDEYIGDWILRLKPNGKWNRDVVKSALAEGDIHYDSYINPYQGLVPIGFAAAVDSNYRLDVALQPNHYLPGANVRITGSLSDRGWPAVDGKIDVTVTSPNNSQYNLKLYDDGTHGDDQASDGTWTNHFTQTAVAGSYKFFFQSIGHNERGELAPREDTRYTTLQQPEPDPTTDGGGTRDCLPCLLLRALLFLGLLLLLWIAYCSCMRRRSNQ